MRRRKWLKKIFYVSLIAMQIITLSPAHKALSIVPNNKDRWELHLYNDTEDLKAKILQNPDFIKNWATIAHFLGFDCCRGTRSPVIGEDFSFFRGVEKDNSGANREVYYIVGNYNSSDKYVKKCDADERLQMKISNIRLIIDPNSFKFKEPKTIDTKPVTIASGVLENTSDEDNDTSLSLTYESNKSWSKRNKFKLSEKIGAKTKFSLSVPLSRNKESILNVEFGTEQGFEQSEGMTMTEMSSTQYYDKIQAKSKKQIDLIGMIKTLEVPYQARIYIEYDITLTGFLKESGNAHVDHPTNRPKKTITFGGRNGLNAEEDLLDIYNNRDIKGYSQWDWQWVIDNFKKKNTDHFIEEFCTVKRGGLIGGTFDICEGTKIEIKSSNEEPINTMIKDEDSFKDNKVEIRDFIIFNTSEFHVKDIKTNK